MSYTIMVIDDEQMILDMLRDQFEMEQYQVITAKSSEEALQKLNQQPDIIPSICRGWMALSCAGRSATMWPAPSYS